MAGEVDDRILDAAREVFLKYGFGGASVDEISRVARAGKPSIYARFPTKKDLFAAVAKRNGSKVMAQFESDHPPSGSTVAERLVQVGTNILRRLLLRDTIDFMRMSVAESRRFPDLVKVGRMARDRAAQFIAPMLREISESSRPGEFPGFAPECVEATTRFFMDLVVARLLMRAVFGENLNALRAEIDSHVAHSVAFFLAACRHQK